ncbi:MAG: heme biosynthesis HemY N-terminal domain-containing protein [Neisseria sp.]|nr:heme biosynthesis HemY N-terminal domain-containing protein [Neisseria sp.]
MKALIWIIVLFAVAVGLALASSFYSGNVYIVAEQTMLRLNLHAFILGILLLVVVWYFIVKLIAGVLNVPSRLQRFGVARKSKNAHQHLQASGLAYFEGQYQKAEQEAAKVLANKEAGDNRNLALMLAAHAADQMDSLDVRDTYLQEIAKLPTKTQLSRYLLLAESALNRRDYAAAQENMQAAAQIKPNLTRLVRLQLRYAFDHGDALDVLDKAAKLHKAAALNDYETVQYQQWAYRRLLAIANSADGMKACLKRLPQELKEGDLCAAIASKYEQLGLYQSAVAWVKKYYPQNKQADLLPPFIHSVRYLSEKEQRKAMDVADAWLKSEPENASLLLHLGQLAFGAQLWGKAQSYLEASLTVQESMQARLALAKVFDAIEEPEKAEAQRLLALEDVVHDEAQAE